MPPRVDPYANKTHRRIDIVLIVVTLALMFVAFRISAHDRPVQNNRSTSAPAAAQTGK
jgi:hypothetical protein